MGKKGETNRWKQNGCFKSLDFGGIGNKILEKYFGLLYFRWGFWYYCGIGTLGCVAKRLIWEI